MEGGLDLDSDLWSELLTHKYFCGNLNGNFCDDFFITFKFAQKFCRNYDFM